MPYVIGVDINRDARRLATPEGRALKSLHDRLKQEFGFNLHDPCARNPAPAMVSVPDGRRWLRIGNAAEYTLRRGPSPERARDSVDSTGSRR